MPKLKRETVQKREEFVVSLFKANPNLSIPKANKLVVDKFAAMMRPQRLYELRRLTNSKTTPRETVEGAVLAADRQA